METYKANSRNISHLEEAIQLAREAIRECPHDETNHLAGRKMTLAANLSLLCEATKEERHLDEAIRYNNEAVRSTKEGDPMRSARLCTLGNTIGKKYNRTNDIKDLEESLEYNREAKRLIRNSTDQAKRINIINSYSVRLLWHFERCGDRESLDESLARMQELVDTTPQDHPMWNQLTSNLCNRLITRYEVGNEQRDFHDAIERAEEAISRCSSMRNIVDKALTLYTLCLTIGARYRTTGALTDLTAAVEYAKQAVRLIPPEHIEYASVLQSKSLTLLMLYERHENPSDLDEAIRSGEDSATVVIHRDRQAMIYTNLGTLYGHRWMLGDKTNDKDLEMAITYCRRRLGLQLREPGGLVNLANWLLATQKRDVLDEAIALAEEAFGMMVEVPDHPDRARVAHTLAKAWESRYRSRGQESDGGAEDRRRAKEGDWTGVYEAAAAAVELLPLLSPRCIKQSDQQHALLQFAGLAGRAAAAALEADRGAPEALRLLECGRCVISVHRFYVGRLRGTHADLAQRFEDLRDRLPGFSRSGRTRHAAGGEVTERHRCHQHRIPMRRIHSWREQGGTPAPVATLYCPSPAEGPVRRQARQAGTCPARHRYMRSCNGLGPCAAHRLGTTSAQGSTRQ
ncbi:hypothetical protein ST47_g1094 [Ascochyta rabiei]|uniref:Uncharacterized protein n=1 Tax=Didymella rabiei TaxID=5454 RepID=A0A163LFV5_DIDRA|nr:hypothetical protein ST47_g1094 [Ascochyta rabiei]